MTEYAEIIVGTADGVATITLNRPARLNAWTATLEHEVHAAVQAAVADQAVRVIVLTGAGRGFCAGADMEGLSRRAAGEAPQRVASTSEYEPRLSYLATVPKPVIAAVNGAAAGIGFSLMLFCDVRFVAAGAKLTTAFVRRGLPAEQACAWMLPRLVGPMNAADLLLSGRVVLGEEADRMGLARLLPAEGFLPAVQRYAAELATFSSPRSMGVIKRQLGQTWAQTLPEASRLADAELAECRKSEDHREGVAAYNEKRTPQFTGR